MNKKNCIKKKYNIQKIFVVNLNRRIDRLKHFKSRYNFNIKLNRIEAVDGRDLNIDELFKNNIIGEYGYNSLKNYRKSHHELTHNGSVGCYLSHYNIWKSIYDKDKRSRNYIIFEDDTILTDISIKYANTELDYSYNKIESFYIDEKRFSLSSPSRRLTRQIAWNRPWSRICLSMYKYVAEGASKPVSNLSTTISSFICPGSSTNFFLAACSYSSARLMTLSEGSLK